MEREETMFEVMDDDKEEWKGRTVLEEHVEIGEDDDKEEKEWEEEEEMEKENIEVISECFIMPLGIIGRSR